MPVGARMHGVDDLQTLRKVRRSVQAWKNYEKEAATIRELIRAHKILPCNDLLDERADTLAFLREAGLQARFREEGLMQDRGLLLQSRRSCPHGRHGVLPRLPPQWQVRVVIRRRCR